MISMGGTIIENLFGGKGHAMVKKGVKSGRGGTRTPDLTDVNRAL